LSYNPVAHLSGTHLYFAFFHQVGGAAALFQDNGYSPLNTICFISQVQGEAQQHGGR
jgi:hypothetical protein